MTAPRRILIVGSAGSGKSTAARMIGAALDLPVYHMDRDVFWLPGWVERAQAERLAAVERIVAQPAWVFEGNNAATFPIREARAQMLIWLDPPLPLRLFRVLRRTVQQRGQTREDMAEGCTEQISMLPGFVWFILRSARTSHAKQRALFEATALPKRRLTSAAAVNGFVSELA